MSEAGSKAGSERVTAGVKEAGVSGAGEIGAGRECGKEWVREK